MPSKFNEQYLRKCKTGIIAKPAMPELPEVETTCRGIAPHIEGKKVSKVLVRERRLRWPISEDLEESLEGRNIIKVRRRGKYLLLYSKNGCLMIHLGMSGSLRIVNHHEAVKKHDHFDIVFSRHIILRYHDPRRFGCALWIQGDPNLHPLLSKLGPEPLEDIFDAEHLYLISRKRTAAIKTFIMDSHVVVGVGNIYANEALFMAGIDPRRKAGTVSRARFEVLVQSIKTILNKAIAVGGTTLKDFVGGDGKPGYFSQSLLVYGRAGEPCTQCKKSLKEIRIGQRSTVFCSRCQS